jgi:UDP-2,3-diacylglucosamine pyrophosphatase LpxH
MRRQEGIPMADNHSIFVISDLHMGDGGVRDNFPTGNRERELAGFLDYVAGREGELVVLGDLFEFWQMNLSHIVIKRMPVLDRLAAMDVTYVLGNHDADLDGFIGTQFLAHPLFERMCGPFTREIGGKQFKFMHGHEVDPGNKDDWPEKGRIFCILAGLFEDRNQSPIYSNGVYVEDDLERIGEGLLGRWTGLASKIVRFFRLGGLGMDVEHLTPTQNQNRAKELLGRYRQDKETGGYDVLIAGHTHQPGRIGNWYFNSGTWARKENSFVEIGATGFSAVYDWVDGRAVPNNTVLVM